MIRYLNRLFFITIVLFIAFPATAELSNYEDIMNTAGEYRQSGRFAEAEELYSIILADNANDSDALVARGFIRMSMSEKHEDAIADFNRVITLSPEYIDAYYGLALIARRQGDWKKVRTLLEEAEKNAGNTAALSYLADIAWQLQNYSLGRDLDRRFPQSPGRIASSIKHIPSIVYSHDLVVDREDWDQFDMGYTLILRPDISIRSILGIYRRGSVWDYQPGLGVSYKPNMTTTLSLDSLFGINSDFLALQKHRLAAEFNIHKSTMLGTGIRSEQYQEGWAWIGDFHIRQGFQSFYGDYSLASGIDGFNEFIATQIIRIGYEGESLSTYLAYSHGDESVDRGDSTLTGQLIQTIYSVVRVPIGESWDLNLSASGEFRDKDYFRTTLAIGISTDISNKNF